MYECENHECVVGFEEAEREMAEKLLPIIEGLDNRVRCHQDTVNFFRGANGEFVWAYAFEEAIKVLKGIASGELRGEIVYRG